MVVIDLFSGAGGLSEGFHTQGYKFVAKIEKEFWACETLKTRIMYHFLKKNKDLDLYNQYLVKSQEYTKIDSYREIIYKKYPELEEAINYVILNKKFGNPSNEDDATSTSNMVKLIEKSMKYHKENNVDIIIGGPPCQAYSLVGRGRMKKFAEKDPRNFLFYYYKNIVDYFRPKAFIFENVPGILTAKNGFVYEKIKEEFANIGYTLLSGHDKLDKKNIIDFKDFGVPQSRKRVILFGFRSELNYNYPNFENYAIKWKENLNSLSVISDLPALEPNCGLDSFFGYYDDFNVVKLNEFQVQMRENSIGILNHKARSIQERDRKIYEIAILKSEEGKQLKYSDLPEDLKTHRNEKSFSDRFKVHRAIGIPHTVVAHIAKDGHYNIHPDKNQLRSLTVREAARIQTFPDNFKFEGPRTAQYVQVGNAVPPLMSNIISLALKAIINVYSNKPIVYQS